MSLAQAPRAAAAEAAAPGRQQSEFPRAPSSHAQAPKLLPGTLCFMASVQVVWFYLCHMHGYINLPLFEQGLERRPFQYRLLIMLPLRWAHNSATLTRWAFQLSAQHSWFPTGVTAEGFVEAPINFAALAVAGWVARDLYRRASPTGLLTAYVYPLVLLMATATYSLLNIHMYRFVYDFPSLACFALGMWFIYTRAHPALFAPLFCVATLNRETTLFLLLLYPLAERARAGTWRWRRTLPVVLPLLAAWTAWHIYVAHLFRFNGSAAGWRVGLNLALLAMPVAWPQLLGVFGYLLPLVLAGRRALPCPVLQSWLWVLPAWFCFMMYYGVLVEIRIFGELIPLVAVAAALLAEAKILARLATLAETR